MRRVHIPTLTAGSTSVRVGGEVFHYLARVLRVGPGDTLEVFDGRGLAFNAVVASLEADELELALSAPRGALPQRSLLLVQGVAKGERMEWVIQKATELGVSAIAPVFCERTVVKLERSRADARVARWTKIAEEAARQCRRSEVPRVLPIAQLLERVESLPRETRVLVLDEQEGRVTLSHAYPRSSPTETPPSARVPVALVCGPEGGLARAEVERLVALGAATVSLGARVLRTETAPLAALVIARHLDGELG